MQFCGQLQQGKYRCFVRNGLQAGRKYFLCACAGEPIHKTKSRQCMAGFDFQAKNKMKIKSLKSQITMMIIVGLVLFILVGIIFYISKSTVKKTAQQGVKTSQGTALDTQPIKEFVSKCQDKLAKEAVMLMGKQGGNIYRSQGGDLVDYLDTDQGSFFIMY